VQIFDEAILHGKASNLIRGGEHAAVGDHCFHDREFGIAVNQDQVALTVIAIRRIRAAKSRRLTDIALYSAFAPEGRADTKSREG
jgi:hypothetical protein